MLDYLTFVSLRSHFAETNLISLSLPQFADKVCKLRRRKALRLLFSFQELFSCRFAAAQMSLGTVFFEYRAHCCKKLVVYVF